MPENRMQLIDQMRGKWERRIAPTIEALQSYVEGFADARSFQTENTWDDVALWVYDYLGIKREVQWHWTEQVARHSLGYGTEIPIFYGALDRARKVEYDQKHVWLPAVEWRAKFSAEQKKLNTLRPDMAIPAPHSILIARVSDNKASEIWRLFYLDDRDVQYAEVTGASCTELQKWAFENKYLEIPENSWHPTQEL